MQVNIQMLDPKSILPEYKTDGAACFDLHALDGHRIKMVDSQTFRTGLAIEIPAGFVMRIYARSGNAFKHDVCLTNGVGVIDSDYRGEILVRLTNHGWADFTVEAGDRIAQAIIEPCERVVFQPVAALGTTARGAAGFGSTGR